MTNEAAAATCPTCGLVRKPEDFYASSAECRPCKRDRSKRNRESAAQKLAFAEGVLALAERLLTHGWRPEISTTETDRPPAALQRRPEAWTEPQEVRP